MIKISNRDMVAAGVGSVLTLFTQVVIKNRKKIVEVITDTLSSLNEKLEDKVSDPVNK